MATCLLLHVVLPRKFGGTQSHALSKQAFSLFAVRIHTCSTQFHLSMAAFRSGWVIIYEYVVEYALCLSLSGKRTAQWTPDYLSV